MGRHVQETEVPQIDFSLLQQQQQRSLVIQQIHEACRTAGFFSVINHGISDTVIEEAMEVNSRFFDLPLMEKEAFISDDVYKPVRYNQNQGGQGVNRDFLKLYSHPFEQFVASWPKDPPDYRDKMGTLAMEMRKLTIQLLGAIMESLNLNGAYLKENFEQGLQMVAINCYPPYSSSNKIQIGAPPHSDHSIITLLLQSSKGLQVLDRNEETWKSVPELKGSVLVLAGDLLEVLSNGQYLAALHRVIHESSDETRLSIASFQSLEMDEILEPAMELVDEVHPRKYEGSSLSDFLKHLASGKQSNPFIETLKIHSCKMEV